MCELSGGLLVFLLFGLTIALGVILWAIREHLKGG